MTRSAGIPGRLGLVGAHLASFVAPPCCGACGAPALVSRALCERCERELAEAPAILAPLQGVDAAWSAASYQGAARELVAGLKFGRRLALAGEAAAVIAARLPAELVRGPLVPVPAAPGRRRRRGFDSAERIGAALAAALACPTWPCLARTGSRRQVGRPRHERLAHSPRVRLVAPALPQATLVDDVATTGATLAACAATLRAGGARQVVAVTFARS